MPDEIRLFGRATLIAPLLGLAATSAMAQFDTGSVVGTVRDSSSAVVPGATVTLTNTQTGIAVVKTTGADGNYEFFTVRPGVYLVTAEKSGFAIALVENVQVQVAARLRVDLQMAVGGVSEKVKVKASAPLRNRHEPARPGDHRRADARAGAERTRVLVAGAARDRRAAVRAEQEHHGDAA
jgi:hypothetical protein